MSGGGPYEHHALAENLPPMSGDEYTGLRESIRRSGLREPVWLYDGRVLDGRNRQKACVELGVKPRYAAFEGDDPAQFVVDQNLHRRNLNEGQLAMVALKFEPHCAREAKKRQGKRTDLHPTSAPVGAEVSEGKATKVAAALVGASERSVERAKRVKRASPKLAKEVEQGARSLRAADEALGRPEPHVEPPCGVDMTNVTGKTLMELLGGIEANVLLIEGMALNAVSDRQRARAQNKAGRLGERLLTWK